MTTQANQSRFPEKDTVDRQNRHETAAPATHQAMSAMLQPLTDASEPAELAIVAVRGYN